MTQTEDDTARTIYTSIPLNNSLTASLVASRSGDLTVYKVGDKLIAFFDPEDAMFFYDKSIRRTPTIGGLLALYNDASYTCHPKTPTVLIDLYEHYRILE